MNYIFALITVVVVSIGAVGGVAADTPNGTDVNATDVEDELAEQLQSETVEEQIDSNVWVESWSETEDGGVRITFDAERPTRVTVTEQREGDRGFNRIAIRQERILPGGTTVHMGDVEAVGITTDETISEGYGVELRLVSSGSSLPETSIAHGVGVGIFTMALGMGFAVHRKRSVDHMEVEEGWK